MLKNTAVLFRRLLSVALLLVFSAAMPQWLGLGAHLLEHRDESAADHVAGLAQALSHGHQHEEGVPGHDHRLVSAPSTQPEPPRAIHTSLALLVSPGLQGLEPSAPLLLREGFDTGVQPGSGPPRLQLLCTLLI